MKSRFKGSSLAYALLGEVESSLVQEGLVGIPKASHLPMLEEPKLLGETLIEFLIHS